MHGTIIRTYYSSMLNVNSNENFFKQQTKRQTSKALKTHHKRQKATEKYRLID